MVSRFLGDTARAITPYAPGEQPQDRKYIKLNTNECPYPPSPLVEKALAGFSNADLRLYPDPDNRELTREMAAYYGLPEEMCFSGGGSDEVLGFAFMAFHSPGDKIYFADITYGFYKVYTDLFGFQGVELPLREDFTLDLDAFEAAPGTVFIANPNAPTGIAAAHAELLRVVRSNPNRLVVVDEAYADFSEEGSCAGLTKEYDNLLVVQTFSKSRTLAGMRLGFAFGNPALIDGLNRVKYSFNPYNIDRVSSAAGIAAIRDEGYLRETVAKVKKTREWTTAELLKLGFTVLPSQSNFLFASCPGMDGGALYQALRERGILVRHFAKPRIDGFLRITVGTDSEMQTLISTLNNILEAM